jgi:hypothetical protein
MWLTVWLLIIPAFKDQEGYLRNEPDLYKLKESEVEVPSDKLTGY